MPRAGRGRGSSSAASKNPRSSSTGRVQKGKQTNAASSAIAPGSVCAKGFDPKLLHANYPVQDRSPIRLRSATSGNPSTDGASTSANIPTSNKFARLSDEESSYNNTDGWVGTSSTDKPTPEQIIEPVLCTRTMISQVYAGMWRRNGYSLLNQLYFYRNVKCRFEMLDRDIVILQIGASLIESNEFLIHILSKFNLIEWTYDNFEPANTTNPEEEKGHKSSTMEWATNDESDEQSCIGKNRKTQRIEEARYRCILCSEESAVTKSGECMVYAAFVQKSSVLSRYQQTDEQGQLKYLETSIHPSPHVTTCGHVMHAACFEKYFSNEMVKENRRPYRNRTPVLFDIEKKEFLCPLCRFLSNALLPLLPTLNSFNNIGSAPLSVPDAMDFSSWYTSMDGFIVEFRNANDKQMEVPQNTDEFEERTALFLQVYEEAVIPKLESLVGEPVYTMESISASLVSNSIEEYVRKFCAAVHDVAPFPTTPSKNFEEYLVTWLSCAYTIESLEMLLRATDKSLSGELSIRYSSCLSGFVRVSAMLGNSIKRSNPSLVNYVCDLHDTLTGKKASSFLEWDLFSMMTSLIFSTRCVLFSTDDTIPKGNTVDHAILTALFLVNALRIVITHDMHFQHAMDTEYDITTSDNCAEESSLDLANIFKKYNIFYDPESQQLPANIVLYLAQAVKDQSQTFLRCCCLFFHALTDIELPGGDSFEAMASYLGLETDVCKYFNDETYSQFIYVLISANLPELQAVKQNIRKKQSEDIVPIIQAIPPVRQLIDLPEDYSDLINSVSLFTCPNNVRDDSRNPTMCLVCGEILCSQSFCCQKELDKNSVGSCTYHVHTCGAGIGIFLRIRDSEILLLGMNKGCFIPAPYLDEYGETDQGLRRGNPLRLCKERYKKLHIIWLSHGIHEEITRRTETQQTLFATQWQNL